MDKRLYLSRKRRRAEILSAAVDHCRKAPGGWAFLTRAKIAEAAECSNGLVSRCLGDMVSVRKAIMKVAVKNDYQEIIAPSRAMHDGFAPRQR